MHIVEHYDGLAEFFETIANRQPNQVWDGHELSSQTGDSEFTNTKSYEEATHLAQTGYEEGLKNLDLPNQRVRFQGKAPRPIPRTAVVGYAPHVPNAITGVPNSMIDTEAVIMRAKVLTFVYGAGASANISTRELVKAGRTLVGLIDSLEIRGYRVGLEVLHAFCEGRGHDLRGGDNGFCTVMIKHWRQPRNPLKLSYPIIHPSFFRRHMFHWLETVPGITDGDIRHGYGKPFYHTDAGEDLLGETDLSKREAWLRKNGIIKGDQRYLEFYTLKEHSVDEVIAMLKL